MASYTYEGSIYEEENENNWWYFTAIGGDGEEEEDKDQILFLLQEIGRFFWNRIQRLERFLISRIRSFPLRASVLKTIKIPTWAVLYRIWDLGGCETTLKGWRLKPYFSQIMEDPIEAAKVSLDIEEPLGEIAQDLFIAQHVPCISIMSLGPATRPCIDTVLCNPGTTSDHSVTDGEDECTSRLQRNDGDDTEGLEQEA